MKLWHKILLGFLGVFVLFSLSGVPTAQYDERIMDAFRAVKEQDLVAIELVEKMNKTLLEMEASIWKYHATRDPSWLRQFQDGEKRWALLAEQVQDMTKDDAYVGLFLRRVSRATEGWMKRALESSTHLRSGRRPELPSLDEIRPLYLDLLSRQTFRLGEGYENSLSLIEQGSYLAWSLRALALLIGLITCLVIVRSVKAQLERLTHATERIAAGQFDPVKKTSNDELGLLTASFNEMSRALKERTEALEEQRRVAIQANRLKTEFLANTSHELRTPLNTIMGYVQLIQDGLARSPQEERSYLQIIQQSSKHLLSLINDVLDVARIETGQIHLEMEPVLIKQVFDQLEEHMRLPAQKKNLRFSVVLRDHDLGVRANSGRLNQVLLNLVGNAIKFTTQGGVDVEAVPDESGDRVRFTVKDTGIGVSLEKQALLFQKFVQMDGSETRHLGGTGLGLALSKSLIELMRGNIKLESEGEGKGTQVVFTLERDLSAK
jgi:signal transduction histidine kinase